MNGKKTILLMAIFVILSISTYIAKLIQDYRLDHFSCGGKIIFIDDKQSYTVQVKYTFEGGIGEITALGEYSESEKQTLYIPQKILFNYTHDGNEFIMLSTHSALSGLQAKKLSVLVPDFYLYTDRGLRIRIFRQRDSRYIFTTYGVPVFICTKMRTQ